MNEVHKCMHSVGDNNISPSLKRTAPTCFYPFSAIGLCTPSIWVYPNWRVQGNKGHF